VGIYELLTMTEPIRDMVMARTNARKIAKMAEDAGEITSLRQAGFGKVAAGQTTFPEVLRATKL
jgi:type II secretory ATPase GspE/PulE/Tfp pilus assembly ATPase PilB-like protein